MNAADARTHTHSRTLVHWCTGGKPGGPPTPGTGTGEVIVHPAIVYEIIGSSCADAQEEAILAACDRVLRVVVVPRKNMQKAEGRVARTALPDSSHRHPPPTGPPAKHRPALVPAQPEKAEDPRREAEEAER